MTRKRFVKLLMAAEYDRNKANEIAAAARKGGVKYSTALNAYIKLRGINISALSVAFRNIADAALTVGYAISKAAQAFGEALREKMEVM